MVYSFGQTTHPRILNQDPDEVGDYKDDVDAEEEDMNMDTEKDTEETGEEDA